MIKLSKRMKHLRSRFSSLSDYDLMTVIGFQQKMSSINFVESVDVAVNLGIDARKSEQNVRGFVLLPHGSGRNVRIAVFTQDVDIEHRVKIAGADEVGMFDLADRIKNKNCQFDVIVASPAAMPLVGKLAPILGPRGLMPNIRNGTISQNIVESVKNIKMGQICYRNDKSGIIHVTIGKISFTPEQLRENLEALIIALKKNKPIQSKGVFIKKVTLSSTMGIGIAIDKSSLPIITN
ncbi:50S ribosomal protein L1 [Blochmannia endosymbiont of Colobopsis nipponica]|uniref:50S ribosomal protein L1 n=1 Tax=Blochmannia endosymbiont of Colobopsis nipponica TaxID=2681987 RepID=UPI00177CF67A|nr:50S ribosomal protein L1 [Blochmannia endosymbiont of Colobopsis nipponica]QOI10916.1 50S ribosomal protein L1 [Blochmannia endosymbiont of Colobopsis nipponica]